MNVIQKILILGVTLFLIFCCKKPPEEPQPDELTGDKAILVGTWNWTHTHHRYNWCVGSELNETIEPEEDEYSFVMKKEGIVEFYKNNSLQNEHSIYFENFYQSEDKYLYYIFLDNEENNSFGGRVWGDTLYTIGFPLYVAEEGCEEYRNYFIKE